MLTRSKTWQAEGAEVAHTVDEALALAGEGPVAVIGGAEVNALFLPLASRIELTEIHADYPGDVAMPQLGPEWIETHRENHDGHSFVTLERAS